MKNIINCTCQNEKVYSRYISEVSGGHTYILPDPDSDVREYCPFDDIASVTEDYLMIGYMLEYGADTVENTLEFVKKYGMPHRGKRRLNADKFAEDAQLLYLHLTEITSRPYPENPEWLLETDPISAIVRADGGESVIEWQTTSLASAIELGYMLLLGSEHYRLGICKNCGKPYFAQNPKTEFCKIACRNRYNVKLHRARQKQDE